MDYRSNSVITTWHRALRRLVDVRESSAAITFVSAVALGVCAMFALSIRARGPYPVHTDEPYITQSAWDIVLTGDPNPHFFNYGSLPIYLSAAAQGVAAAIACARGDIKTLSDVSSIAFPYYSHASISLAPRILCVIAAIAALCATARLGFHFSQRVESAVLPPVVLALSPLFQEQAWSYINVDIFATALTSCGIAFLLPTHGSTAYGSRVLWPALFCGAVMATKYNAGLLGVPFALATMLSPPGRRLRQLLGVGVASLAFFLLFEPFAALDWENFIAAVLSEMHHYKTGHAGNEGEAGFPQLLFYLDHFLSQFGTVPAALTLIGIAYGSLTEPKKTALLLSFPLCSVLFMSLQRVNYIRNVLPAFALLTPFMALGLTALENGAQRLWRRLVRSGQPPTAGLPAARILVTSALVALAYSSDFMRPAGAFEVDPGDSRVALVKWLRRKASRPCVVVVPSELNLRPGGADKYCTLEFYDAHQLAGPTEVAQRFASLRNDPNAFIVVPRFAIRPHRNEDPKIVDTWNELPAIMELERPVFRAGNVSIRWSGWRSGNPRLTLYRLGS